jgi:hypothetical protein
MLWKGNECGKNSGDANGKAAIPNTGYDRIKSRRRMWNISAVWITLQQMMQHVHGKLNSWFSWRSSIKQEEFFTSKLDLNLRKKIVKCYIWIIALCGVETGIFRKVDQKYLESFEMWCWERTVKTSWTDCVIYKEVLRNIEEQRNVLH